MENDNLQAGDKSCSPLLPLKHGHVACTSLIPSAFLWRHPILGKSEMHVKPYIRTNVFSNFVDRSKTKSKF